MTLGCLLLLLLSSCGKTEKLGDPDLPPPLPPEVFRTTKPVTGFFKVTKILPYLLGRETKIDDGTSWVLSEDYLRWDLTIPGEEIIITENLQGEEYQRLRKEYGIRDDIHYFSPSPIREFYLARGVSSISLVLEDNQAKARQSLSDRTTLDTKVGMERWFANPEYAGEEIIFPKLGGHLRVQLDKISPIAFQWGIWYSPWEGDKPPREDYRLILNRKGVDITQGRLLLIVEREGDTPLEVELPQA